MGKHHLKIGVDLTGGDLPPETVFQQLLVIQEGFDPSLHLVFFATAPLIEKFLSLCQDHPHKDQFSFVETQHIISMSDSPLSSVRLKKNSPSLAALKLMKTKELDALVSTGNSGALVAGCSLILKTIKGIRRAGLLTLLPTLKNPLVVIDVGASLSACCQHLMQFAKMGIAYQQSLGNSFPNVGLLNIGSEKEKGTIEMREAYKKLMQLSSQKESKFGFIGNIEAKKAFLGEVDVLVTEGFAGNIFLKTAEGVTAFIIEKLRQEPQTPSYGLPSLLTHHLNYAEYPGALVCGIEGIVIKCHGDSTGKAVHSGIMGAKKLLDTHFLKHLKTALTMV